MRDELEQEKRIVVVFRNDDPSAISDVAHEREIYKIFENWAAPQTIGVVPFMTKGSLRTNGCNAFASLSDNPEMCSLLVQHCLKTGSELALHGLTHQSNRYSLPKRRFWFEFARLPLAEQEAMIAQGLQIIEESTGQRAKTFIPPWNRLDCNTILACRRQGIETISAKFFVPPSDGITTFGVNSNIKEFHAHLDLARRGDLRVFIHVLFHSPSMIDPAERGALEAALKAARDEPECNIMTIREVALRFPHELRTYNLAGRAMIGLSDEMGSKRARAALYASVTNLASRAIRGPGATTPILGSYRRGDYEECIKADKNIEKATRAQMLLYRLGIFCLGSAAALCGLLLGWSGPLWVVSGTALICCLGAVCHTKLTSPDSRRELVTAMCFFLAGWLSVCIV